MDEGDVVIFEEYIHGELHRLKLKITQVDEGRKVEYRFLFPTSMLFPGGSFLVEPKGEGSVSTATVSVRGGAILSIFAGGRAEALRVHMREEGENLKRLLEKEQSPAGLGPAVIPPNA